MSGERQALQSKPYAVVGRGSATPPQYDRVTASLSTDRLEEELETERGKTDAGWRNALLGELERRRR